MAQENNNMLYSIKILTIPDFVLPMDIPKIINWFDYYNIANVKNVEFREHPEPEYYVEDKPYYGYAVIEIDEWYKNNSSRTFYEYLASGSAKMVYDDPYYWVVEFYEARTQEEVNNIVMNLNDVSNNEDGKEYNKEEFSLENEWKDAVELAEGILNDNKEDEADNEYNKEEFSLENEWKDAVELAEGILNDNKEDEADNEYYSEEFIEYKLQKRSRVQTRSMTKRTEDKSKSNLLNTENLTLKDIIVKKNKNFNKREKRKRYKNERSRRLRQKLEGS